MVDLIAYKSNALVEASYKLTLQEQRFLLLCISRLQSGVDAPPPELQKTMTITAVEFLIHFLTWEETMPKKSYRKRSIVCGTGRSFLRMVKNARSSVGSSIGRST